ncbi:MAG: hypothetical protein IBJ11_06525 [Phycisphaerales bacterium]|nr:hypothetical protein [Phycisphaerales bacterium]
MPRRRDIAERLALSLFSEEPELLRLAKRVTDASGRPMVGGLAVFLHGYRRTTEDLDVYSADFAETRERLEAAGIRWDARHRQFDVEGVPLHLVGDDWLGGPRGRTSTIRGVRVVGLSDLIRGKLTVGLESPYRAKDIAEVVELIRAVPLKKDFAPKLPKHLRPAFKELVEHVHEPRRTPRLPTLDFWKKYA